MSPVLRPKGRKFTAQKARTVKRIERWRGSDLRRDQCVSGASLAARELDAPGSVWPPRPRARYRQPQRLRPLARQFADLVQEQQEHGAAALVIAHYELAQLAGYKNRTDASGRRYASSAVQAAVAEAKRHGLVEQVPYFDELDDAAPARADGPRPMHRATKVKHGLREGKPAYRLGPLAIAELQRAEDRVTGDAERKLSAEATAEARKLAARSRRFSPRYFEGSDPSLVLPEEAPEDPRTASRRADAGCAGASVSPAATVSELSRGYAAQSVSPAATFSELSQRRRGGPTADAPPLELRNSWTREAATPPPRRAESPAATPPPASPQTRAVAPAPPVAASADHCEGCKRDLVVRLLHAALARCES